MQPHLNWRATSLQESGLSNRVQMVLEAHNVKTMGDAADLTLEIGMHGLLRSKNFGRTSLHELIAWLARYDRDNFQVSRSTAWISSMGTPSIAQRAASGAARFGSMPG